MYIRHVRTRNNTTGEWYFTHRLVVRTERIAGRVRQLTLLNLGRHFAVAQEDWPSMCPRIAARIRTRPLYAELALDPNPGGTKKLIAWGAQWNTGRIFKPLFIVRRASSTRCCCW